MRIQCAKCAAKYEIADTAIPPEGREVECSACHERWFERGQRALLVRRPPELGLQEAVGAPMVQRRSVTPAIAEILREEAAIEGARRAETVPANLSAMPPKLRAPEKEIKIQETDAKASPQKLAAYVMPPPILRPAVIAAAEDLLATTPRPAPVLAPSALSPSALSPSALAPSALAGAPLAADASLRAQRPEPAPALEALPGLAADPCDEKDARYFGGMIWAFIVITLLLLAYLLSPVLLQKVPALAPILEPYVAMIDGWRLWVQNRAGNFVVR